MNPKRVTQRALDGVLNNLKRKAGKNALEVRGRVGGKALKPGNYRLNGTAIDPAKNTSLPKRKDSKIVK